VDSRGARCIAGAGYVLATIKARDPFFDNLSEEIRAIITAPEQSLLGEHVQDLLASLNHGPAGLDRALAIVTNGFRDELGPAVTDQVLDRVALGYTRGTVDIVHTTRWDFNSTDEKALEWLGKDATYWIGDYHGSDFSRRVAEEMADAFREGLSQPQLRERLVTAFAGQFSRSDAYWEMFGVNVVTRSRTFGTTEGLVRSGAIEGEFSAVLDDTTSGICRAMDGRIIRVSDMTAQRDRILSLTNPEDIKTVAPWRTSDEQIQQAVSFADMLGYVPRDIQPPLHGNCRSTINFRR